MVVLTMSMLMNTIMDYWCYVYCSYYECYHCNSSYACLSYDEYYMGTHRAKQGLNHLGGLGDLGGPGDQGSG